MTPKEKQTIITDGSIRFEPTDDGFIIIEQTSPPIGKIVIHASRVKTFTDQLLHVARNRKVEPVQTKSQP